MAVMYMMEFPGVTPEKYDQIMKEMGLDKKNAKWPKGILSHAAGPYESGLAVVDVWQSEADFGKFRENQLAPAMQKVGGMPEPRVTTVKVHFSHPPAAGKKK